MPSRSPRDPRVQNLGIKISAIWPIHNTEFRMDPNFAKFERIAKWCKNSIKRDEFVQCHDTFHSILKSDLEAIRIGRNYGNDIFEHYYHSFGLSNSSRGIKMSR